MKMNLVTDEAEILTLPQEVHSYLRGMEFPFAFLVDGIVVAKGELEFDSGEVGSVEVKMIKSVEERKGYGKLFVEHLKSLDEVKEIWGESLPVSVPFWFKMGAKFEESVFNEFIENDEHEEGFLVPFTIAC